MLKALTRLGVVLSIFSSALTFAGYSTLAETRRKMRFPDYSTETKKIVFEQAKIALTEIFVHQDIKNKDFGTGVDPLPKLNALEKELGTISDTEFHQTMTDIFRSLKDLHTLYYLPKPFSCYESFLPISFKIVRAGQGRRVFAITDFHTKKEVVDLIPKPFDVALGDTVISYNGIPTYEAVRNTMNETYGANEEAQFRLAQDDLRYYAHSIDHLPKEDNVELELQNAKGERYKLKLPWITYVQEDCINPPPSLKPARRQKTRRMGAINGATDEPILYWHVNRPDFGDFGYIELTSFTPEVFSNDETVLKIRNLLLNELKDTAGLVIDLRSNGGGQIPFAEKIIQLLTPNEITPINYILKNSETNYIYMTKSDIEDPFTELLKIARNLGQPFTGTYPISVKAEINDLGQAYFKPVAVFVNSKCYSACEVFAAQIQDHNVGTVFGEDLRTGGGGANVYNLNKILGENFAQTNPAPFQKLPAGQDIQFSFRQTLRVGKQDGTLIENQGVRVDQLSPMSRTDIFNATNDQLMVLQKYLAQVSPQYTSKIFFASEDRYDLTMNQSPLIHATWEDTSTFKFKQNGKEIETREVDLNSSSSFALPIDASRISDGRIEILGSKEEALVWRKIVNYRVIPDYKVITQSSNILNDFAFFSVISTKENGWHKNGDELILGNGVNYQSLIESEASVFVTLPQSPASLNFTATIDTEKDYDFLRVVAIADGQKIELISPLSGNLPESKYQMDLSALAGKNVEIRFSFKSDEETKDKGVTLKDLQIEI